MKQIYIKCGLITDRQFFFSLVQQYLYNILPSVTNKVPIGGGEPRLKYTIHIVYFRNCLSLYYDY